MDLHAWTVVRDHLEGLNVPLGVSMRTRCPLCSHTNTLSVTNDLGKLLYFCYSASCEARGSLLSGLSDEDRRSILANRRAVEPEWSGWPDFITPIEYHPDALNWLAQWHITGSMTNGLLYDIRQDRVIFTTADINGKCSGGTGRSITGKKPKWVVYGSGRHPYQSVNSTNSNCVVVEDCISALRLSPFVSGVALQGTVLKDEHIPFLMDYTHVKLALDLDASTKALKMREELNMFVPTKVILLTKDIKNFTDEEIRTNIL